eukprot:6856552-Heterocapsa_arctica.AAC.1
MEDSEGAKPDRRTKPAISFSRPSNRRVHGAKAKRTSFPAAVKVAMAEDMKAMFKSGCSKPEWNVYVEQ